MRLEDFIEEDGLGGYESEHNYEPDGLKNSLREILYREIPSDQIAGLAQMGRAYARRELTEQIDSILKKHDFPHLKDSVRDQVIDDTLNMILGLGPIERLLEDDTVTEVMVNGPGKVFFEREGTLHPGCEVFSSEEQLRLVVDRIVAPLGRRVDDQSPIVNARLPEGHRVNVVIPPLSMGGTALTIRKFKAHSYSLEDLVRMESLDEEMATLLSWAVRARKNIAVSGGTGGGKTTMLNALSHEIPLDERIITIEDSAELRFDRHPHVVRMEARLANSEGTGEVTIRDLVINALRMRPDRIVVGECRDAEAADMLQAMMTGHDGSLTTLHAGSPEEVVSRLVMMVRYGMDLPVEIIKSQIHSALDIVVQQDRMPGGRRRVTCIAEKYDFAYRPENDEGFFRHLVNWDREANSYCWERAPDWLDDLVWQNIASAKEVESWRHSVSFC